MQGEREREGGRGRVKQGRSALSPSLKSRDSSLSLPLILGAKGSIGGMEKGRGREGGRQGGREGGREGGRTTASIMGCPKWSRAGSKTRSTARSHRKASSLEWEGRRGGWGGERKKMEGGRGRTEGGRGR